MNIRITTVSLELWGERPPQSISGSEYLPTSISWTVTQCTFSAHPETTLGYSSFFLCPSFAA